MSKYQNKKTQIDMYVFDSIAESKRYKELALLEKAGQIKELKLQPKFLLQEGFKKNGKTYRKIEYIADFMYIENGKIIIPDDCRKISISDYNDIYKNYSLEIFLLK